MKQHRKIEYKKVCRLFTQHFIDRAKERFGHSLLELANDLVCHFHMIEHHKGKGWLVKGKFAAYILNEDLKISTVVGIESVENGVPCTQQTKENLADKLKTILK